MRPAWSASWSRFLRPNRWVKARVSVCRRCTASSVTRVPRGNGETILIVDDDAPLVPLAEEILAALGYEAVGYHQSAAALEVFRAAPDRFDLVLTDDIMPEMTGTELAGVMHEIRPNVPIILMTGGGRPVRTHRLH